MISSEQWLEQASNGESIDASQWPEVLGHVLSQIDYIVRNEFPHPPESSLAAQKNNLRSDIPEDSSDIESASQDKENANPVTPPPSSRPAGSDPQSEPEPEYPFLPPDVLAIIASIRASLNTSFVEQPPHTIQRIAELILRPKQYYRFLPSYLRAVDRVVAVSSPSTYFPLPQASPITGTGLLNGASGPGSSTLSTNPVNTLGSDESLGGALLTPIPWLVKRDSDSEAGDSDTGSLNTSPTRGRDGGAELKSEKMEIVDGPNGAGRIETVTVVNGVLVTSPSTSPVSPAGAGPQIAAGAAQETEEKEKQASVEEELKSAGGVTQGELIRQEQEHGEVPKPVATPRILRSNSAAAGAQAALAAAAGPAANLVQTEDAEEKEVPHARGPEEVGVEDMGPQPSRSEGLNIEAAVGRSTSKLDEPSEKKDVDTIMGDADDISEPSAGSKSKKVGETSQDEADVKMSDADEDAT
ncbi:hypothetical protein K402DRAFT_419291 [Aulographum hederae CBS 113979]|uniref:PPP4R2-domain-containing protein n=1 Tax=Aulographum hederae CBS 113979 TaxID=1176131 RepID=A0A6G1H5U1_9PEZI|nr:hypothetical protein K402DRAFT_419291 [Aulographum hederae CBS 113979]